MESVLRHCRKNTPELGTLETQSFHDISSLWFDLAQLGVFSASRVVGWDCNQLCGGLTELDAHNGKLP